ncbi:MAG: S41 family peptidase [Bacteroidota bacterium]
MNPRNYLPLFIVLFLFSCQPERKPDREKGEILFLELWEIFDQHYAFFELREVDWKKEKKQGLALLKGLENDSLIFEQICTILSKFGDAHINLYANEIGLSCNAAPLPYFYKEFPTNESFGKFLKARNQSLKKLGITKVLDSKNKIFQYGISPSKNWAYFRIKRFYGLPLEAWKVELAEVIQHIKEAEKIIIDIRVNPGGNDPSALEIASYFFQQKEIAFIKQVRNGPDYEDFSEADTTYVIPHPKISLKASQVYLLTNGASGSSADAFALVMSQLPELKIIGTPTEGIFSDVYRDTLSNGWSLSLSDERYYGKDLQCFEGKGVPVDVEIENKKEDVAENKDALIEYLHNEK